MEITLGETLVELLPGRAALFRQSRTLVIADLHLGKSATFRTRGLPIPEGTTEHDLAQLSSLIARHPIDRLVIAGDLVHSYDGLTSSVIEKFSTWAAQVKLPIVLTEGNHDSRAQLARVKLPLEIVPSLKINDVIITHDPADLPTTQPGLAGHLHPGIRIRESGRSSIRTAGFFLRNREHLILPAFSEFTGTHPIKPTKNDQFFAQLSDQVIEIPQALIR